MEIREFKEKIRIPYKNKNERISRQLLTLIIGVLLTMLIIAFYDILPIPNILLIMVSTAWILAYAFYNFDSYTREVISEYKISDNRIRITHALCITPKGKFRRVQKVFYFSDIKDIEYEEDYRRVTILGKGTQRIYKVDEFGDEIGYSQPEAKECTMDEFFMKPSSYKRLKKTLKNYKNIVFTDYFF